ncbi:MAG: DegT/DnrJ/EryC1/StrS family aminotransferase [Cellvibrio sp.]
METLRALIRGDLSPAGNKISVVREPQSFGYQIDGYTATWVDSGTSALALALMDIKKKAQSVATPKVIIPGYCCPDLVAAAVYAGVKPVVVDVGVNDASYDMDALGAAIMDKSIVAIVAINFLGVKERLDEIKKLVQHTPIKIIEDNAQWFPASKEQHQFLGDYLLFSFGRGKPLSLLGGGVLFSNEPLQVDDVILPGQDTSNSQLIKTHLYNILLNPHFYCYLNRAPFLQLGETHYHQHEKIESIGAFQKNIFFQNLIQYEKRDRSVEKDYERLLKQYGLQCFDAVQSDRRMCLLRYPLLCQSSVQRDKLLGLLNSQGLGASPLYQRAIDEIPLVLELVEVQGNLKNARQFARRLLTLPVHQQVNDRHIVLLQKCLVIAA